MRFDFRFRTAENCRDRQRIIDFVSKQNLGYPNYQDWVQRTEFEIEQGYKTGILALSNNIIVGDLIFQPHKEYPRVRELKNMRVHSQFRCRNFMQFMLRQVECGLGTEFDFVMCDVRASQTSTIGFMEHRGYRQIAKIPLYEDSQEEVIMIKSAIAGQIQLTQIIA